MTDGSSGGDGGKLREESEMVRWFSEVKDLRQDNNFSVISVDSWQSSIFNVSIYDDIQKEHNRVIRKLQVVINFIKETYRSRFERKETESGNGIDKKTS